MIFFSLCDLRPIFAYTVNALFKAIHFLSLVFIFYHKWGNTFSKLVWIMSRSSVVIQAQVFDSQINIHTWKMNVELWNTAKSLSSLEFKKKKRERETKYQKSVLSSERDDRCRLKCHALKGTFIISTTDPEETIFTPFGAPAVLDNPIVLTCSLIVVLNMVLEINTAYLIRCILKFTYF